MGQPSVFLCLKYALFAFILERERKNTALKREYGFVVVEKLEPRIWESQAYNFFCIATVLSPVTRDRSL